MNRKGFTLVEILVSASLLVIVATSFFYVFKNSAGFQKKAEHKLKTAYVLQAKMEELLSLSFEELKLQKEAAIIDSDLLEIKVGEIYTLRAR